MLFSSAMVQERDPLGSSSKAAHPVKVTPPHPPPDITPPLAPLWKLPTDY